MLAHTIHKSKHRPQTPIPPTAPTRQRTQRPTRTDPTGVLEGGSGNQPHTGLLPQTPNSAPPDASSHQRPGPIFSKPLPTGPKTLGSTFESDRHIEKTSACKRLLRKEVIQPHLPVRLPCYDFVPIASPTFTHSLPEGLGHKFRVLPTFMT